MTEKLTIDTPEQIALDYTLAGVGSRCLAVTLDTLIQVVLLLLLVLIVLGASILVARVGGPSGLWPLAVGLLGGFLVFYGYFAAFEIFWQGQTPGKRIVGLRVISESGHPLTAQAALLRNLVRIVDALPGIYAIGVITMLISSRSQRLGDLAAGTVVVHERALSHEEPVMDLRGAARLGAARLTEEEFALVTTFLRRRQDLLWEIRESTAREVAGRVRRRLGIAEGGSDEELLERVAAEYRASRGYR